MSAAACTGFQKATCGKPSARRCTSVWRSRDRGPKPRVHSRNLCRWCAESFADSVVSMPKGMVARHSRPVS